MSHLLLLKYTMTSYRFSICNQNFIPLYNSSCASVIVFPMRNLVFASAYWTVPMRKTKAKGNKITFLITPVLE